MPCGAAGRSGLFAIKSAYMLGAARVIAIDHYPERLQMAADYAGAETLNYNEVEIGVALRDMTGGNGPDACIDAVGMEAHGGAMDNHHRPGTCSTQKSARTGRMCCARPL